MRDFIDILTWVLVGIAYLILLFLVRGQLAGRLDKPRWKPALWCFVIVLAFFVGEMVLDGFNQRPLGRFLLILAGAYFSASQVTKTDR